MPDEADSAGVRRRIGRVTYGLHALDLTKPALLARLGLVVDDLVGDDHEICQVIADLAVDAGFDGLIAPSAAAVGEATVAVFGDAIRDRDRARDVVDLGVKTLPPSRR